MSLRVLPLAEAHLAGYEALFEASGSPCFCRYWHFVGTKNDWLDRCVNARETNFEEHAEAVRRGDDAARGLVALASGDEGDVVVGWMKLAPRARLTKLTSLPVYRGALGIAAGAGPG
ncbi:hypothetical protein EON77_10900, partial [bacterium]